MHPVQTNRQTGLRPHPRQGKPGTGRAPDGFSLVELMAATAFVAILIVVLAMATGAMTESWKQAESRLQGHQEGRAALDFLARELAPAVVDTRMQFVVMPAAMLADAGAANVTPDTPALLWMAPLGGRGDLRCVGYYLTRDDDRRRYELKRLFIAPDHPGGYFPRMINPANPRDPTLRTDPVSARWFLQNWDATAFDDDDPGNELAVTASAADRVIGFWVACIDRLGAPIPWLSHDANHPSTSLQFNSAAYFHLATESPFQNGTGIAYLTDSDQQAMKANLLPAAIEVALVTVDQQVLELGLEIPAPVTVLDALNRPDLEASLAAFETQLLANNIRTARVFRTRIELINGR